MPLRQHIYVRISFTHYGAMTQKVYLNQRSCPAEAVFTHFVDRMQCGRLVRIAQRADERVS
jgi:ribosomal protein S27AE